MPRYKLTLEYDGRPFVGWQRQANGLSVQEAVETAIESLTGTRAPIQAAGRTDAGVHATGQVVHVVAAERHAILLRAGGDRRGNSCCCSNADSSTSSTALCSPCSSNTPAIGSLTLPPISARRS